MKRRTKWVLVGLAAVGLVALVGVVAAMGRDEAKLVRIEPVGRRDLVATVTANGWVRPRTAVDVQSDVMGRVIDLRVEEGESVTAGQLLLRIDPAQYEAAVRRAEAAVSEAQAAQAQARANLFQAEQALNRAERLAESDQPLISPRELEEAQTQVRVQTALLEAAGHRVGQSRAALQEARNELEKTVIRAPLSGVVTRLNVEQGEMAIVGTMNNPGSLLLTISDLGVMETVVQVDETDVPQISLGDSAVVQIDAFPRQRFTGVVTEIGHSAVRPPSSMTGSSAQSSQAIDFEVVIRLDEPPPGLRPDLSATADVVTARREQTLSVPIIALTVRERDGDDPVEMEQPEARAAQRRRTEDADQEGVFVVREGKAHFVPVVIGIAGQEHFEVLRGVEEGDSVVAGPYDVIRDLDDEDAVRSMMTETGNAQTTAARAGRP